MSSVCACVETPINHYVGDLFHKPLTLSGSSVVKKNKIPV